MEKTNFLSTDLDTGYCPARICLTHDGGRSGGTAP